MSVNDHHCNRRYYFRYLYSNRGKVVAVVYSLVLSIFFYKSIKPSELPKIFLDSAEMTGIIIFLIGVSSIMSWVMAFTEHPEGSFHCNVKHQ